MRVGVHRCGVEDGDSVPAGLDLDGEMALEAMAGFDVAEDGFKRSVLEGGTVHVASDPAVPKGRRKFRRTKLDQKCGLVVEDGLSLDRQDVSTTRRARS